MIDVGSAEAPKQVNSGATVTYAITQTDMDTWATVPFPNPPNPMQLIQVAEVTCDVQKYSITSMNSAVPAFRSFNSATGVTIYDVSGTAKSVTVKTVFVDRYKLVNTRPRTDVIWDLFVVVGQTVIVSP